MDGHRDVNARRHVGWLGMAKRFLPQLAHALAVHAFRGTCCGRAPDGPLHDQREDDHDEEDVEEAAQAAKLLDRLAPDVDHREEYHIVVLLLFGDYFVMLLLLLLLRVVASRRAASLEPQLSKILWALLLATAVDLYGPAPLISATTTRF